MPGLPLFVHEPRAPRVPEHQIDGGHVVAPLSPEDLPMSSRRSDQTPGGTPAQPGTTGPPGQAEHAAPREQGTARPQDRQQATARQKEQYGGVKLGSAFFGWLTATGTAVLLTALVVAAGTAVGVTTGTGVDQAVGQATQGTQTAQSVGIAGGIALLVVLFVAYFCGGYVAGRMARFNGLRQGVAVWLWAVVVAVVVAVLASVAGDRYDVLSQLNSFPRIPVTSGDLTTGGLIALAAVAASSLIGAIAGGLAGMRFHRKVDQAAFEPYGS